MWIERLDIRGFKRLSAEIEFARGLTVVCGVNEAGKSSLHDAILRTLFGFTPRELRRTGGESEQERCRPWNGGAYAINAVVHTDAGRHRIEWDFAEHEVDFRNLDTGEDLTPKVSAKGREVRLGKYLLGLDLEDFRQSCCVKQGEIAAVPKSESLVAALRQAVEAGGGDTGVEEAIDRLYKALSEQIGARRDNLAPTPTGRLRELQDRGATIREKLEAAEAERHDIAELERDRRQVHKERERAEADLRRVEQGLLRAESERLAERLEEIRELRTRAAQEVTGGPDIDEGERSKIAVHSERLDELRGERATLEPLAEAAHEPMRQLDARRAELERERVDLAGYERVDPSRAAEVQGLVARRESQAAAVAAESGTDADRGPVPAYLWTATGLVAAGSLALAAVAGPVALAGLAVAAVLGYLAFRSRNDRARAELRSDAAETERRDTDRELAEILDAIAAPAAADPSERARSYLDACARHHRRNEIDAQLGRIRDDIDSTGKPIAELRQVEQGIQDGERGLRERYRALGIEADDLSAAAAELDRLAEASRKRAETRQEIREAESNLRVALSGQTVAELEDAHSEAEAKLRRSLDLHGELTATGSRDDLDSRLREVNEVLGELSNRHSSLQGQIEAREKQLPNVPELSERLRRIDDEVSELVAAAEAIAVAREVLEESARQAHSAFRPRLKQALDRNLVRITGGRYSRVELDEDLDLELLAPETGQLVPATRLSRGTQDQIYFLERLEILDMLDPSSGDAPLLLDEPFVNYDTERLEGALELLAEETSERQVILFTCHEALVEAARDTREDVAVIALDDPQGAARGAPDLIAPQ